jgi:hypothetical protein
MADPFSMAPNFSWVDEGADPVQAAAEAAAARTRNAGRSHYGRPEGKATAVLDHLGTGIYDALARPSRIWGALNAMQPGEALSDHPEIVDQGAALSLDMLGAPAVTPGGIVKGAAGIFGGKLAQTADHAKLARAESMAAQGASPNMIRDVTGWFQGVDGKWRFEIPDNAAKLTPDAAAALERGAVGDSVFFHNADRVIEHPELHAAYPDLWSAQTYLTKGGGFPYRPSGRFEMQDSGRQSIHIDANDAAQARDVGLHELQHAVQQREGFAGGGSPSNFTQQKEAELARSALSFRRELAKYPLSMGPAARENAVIKEYQELGAMDMLPSREARDLAHARIDNPDDQLHQLVKAYGLDQRVTPYSGRDIYHRLAGEVEARNVQKRADWTPQQRADTPPNLSQDVPDKNQIVKFGGSAPMSMAPDLPMDKANREARAVTQGFLPPVHGQPPSLYHETTAANAAGIEAGGFDVSKLGARAGDEQMPNGVFLKRNGKSIGLTRPDDAEVQIPLIANLHTKIKEFPDRDALSRHLRQDKKYASIADEQKLIDQEYKSKMADLENRAWTRDKSPDSIAAQGEIDQLLKDWTDKGNDIAARARERSTELLKKQGLDGIRVWNDAGSFGRKVDTTVMFDPANLRSPYAKFDPANAGKNMILGANTGRIPFGMLPDRGD